MLQRALAVFLAIMTLWSALASQELALPGPGVQLAHSVSQPVGGKSPGGSIEEHHLDDQPGQPGQPVAEHASDHPAWFPTAQAPMFLRVASPGIATRVLSTPSGIVPGVPQRPPRA